MWVESQTLWADMFILLCGLTKLGQKIRVTTYHNLVLNSYTLLHHWICVSRISDLLQSIENWMSLDQLVTCKLLLRLIYVINTNSFDWESSYIKFDLVALSTKKDNPNFGNKRDFVKKTNKVQIMGITILLMLNLLDL